MLLGAASPQHTYMSKLRLQTGPDLMGGGQRGVPIVSPPPHPTALTGGRGVVEEAQLAGVAVLLPGGQCGCG